MKGRIVFQQHGSRQEEQDKARLAGAGQDHPQPSPMCPCSPSLPLADPLALQDRSAYLAHLFMEVFLQARDALERVDIETYTAAGGRGGGREGDMVRTTSDCTLHPQRHRAVEWVGGDTGSGRPPGIRTPPDFTCSTGMAAPPAGPRSSPRTPSGL